ncbi:MAG: UDP-glucose/GDP-mannose dehydrogenase family protein [Deltaproteobacteria bacterium]|nr:UDP-glucose/GDP-mannose dehydrogenase family protein [Deltaproteobacteria bacterium]
MNISVIGTGYVGLVAGACFADSGNDVICADIDEKKIQRLTRGEIPIYEPGLEELVKRNIKDGRLQFTTDITYAVKNSLVCFIAVGTPPGEDGSADLKYVLEAARDIGKAMDGYRIMAGKSTVPVGTADKVRAAIREELNKRSKNHEFDVVSNPEFLKEGAALDDFMKPDRVVIGADSSKAAEIMRELYAPFVRTGKPILIMDIRSAEMTKYAANALLATKISFINEIANLCEAAGADIDNVRRGIGTDSRIGFEFLFPGVGYGGSCFPKDVQAIIRTAGEHGYDMKVLKSVEEVNCRQKGVVVDKILKYFGARGKGQGAKDKPLEGNTIGIWGLSFKPRTDDMREAPSITIINRLLDLGARIKAHDPEAMDEARKVFGNRIEYIQDNYEVLKGADALAVITEWNEFRRPNFEKMRNLMKSPVTSHTCVAPRFVVAAYAKNTPHSSPSSRLGLLCSDALYAQLFMSLCIISSF